MAIRNLKLALTCAVGVLAGMGAAFLVSSVSMTSPGDDAPGLPRLVHKHSRSTYGVYGNTVDEMRRSLGTWGPGGHWGYAFWRFEWDADLRNGPGGLCQAENLTVTLRTSTRTPVLGWFAFPPSCPRASFELMRVALERHEQEHVDIAVRTANEIREALASVPADFSCGRLRANLGAAMSRIVDAGALRQSRFDADTSNGQTEGVRLRDCP